MTPRSAVARDPANEVVHDGPVLGPDD